MSAVLTRLRATIADLEIEGRMYHAASARDADAEIIRVRQAITTALHEIEREGRPHRAAQTLRAALAPTPEDQT